MKPRIEDDTLKGTPRNLLMNRTLAATAVVQRIGITGTVLPSSGEAKRPLRSHTWACLRRQRKEDQQLPGDDALAIATDIARHAEQIQDTHEKGFCVRHTPVTGEGCHLAPNHVLDSGSTCMERTASTRAGPRKTRASFRAICNAQCGCESRSPARESFHMPPDALPSHGGDGCIWRRMALTRKSWPLSSSGSSSSSSWPPPSSDPPPPEPWPPSPPKHDIQ